MLYMLSFVYNIYFVLIQTFSRTISLVGRRGYRAPPGNQFLIDVSRLEKYHRKRFAMLKN